MVLQENPIDLMKCLIFIAWSDGNLNHKEVEILNEYIIQFDFSENDILNIFRWMLNPPKSEEIMAMKFDEDDSLFVISQAYVMAVSDESLSLKEMGCISEMIKSWNVSDEKVRDVKDQVLMFFDMQKKNEEKQLTPKEVIKMMSLE